MYANLLVHVGADEPLVAHEIVIVGPRDVEVHLDDPENEGSYAEPSGVTTLDPDRVGQIRITANF